MNSELRTSISLIVAVAKNGVIGRDGDLPWRLSSDLRRFRRLTTGNPVIMGRKTFDSILARLGKPLPDRTSIVLTRNADFDAPPGVLVATNFPQAIAHCGDCEQAFVIGGEQIYRLALPYASRLFLTTVEMEVEGDACFPEWDRGDWVEQERERVDADEKNDASTIFQLLERTSSSAPVQAGHPTTMSSQ